MGSIDRRIQALERRNLRGKGSLRASEARDQVLRELEELADHVNSMDKHELAAWREREEALEEREELEALLRKRRTGRA
jgi:hypothetical protein